MALTLHTIIASTRPARIGPAVAEWFHERALEHGRFEARLVDLADFALPVFDEPRHPRLQQYEHEHTRAWAASVAAADAFVFVIPEYNHGPPPALINALDYVYREWNEKPCGFVSYGGASGGVRAVQTTKLTVTTLKMMPMVESISVPMVNDYLDDTGRFAGHEPLLEAAQQLLDALHRWATALKPMRASR